jgi:TolA-binding protein
MPPARTGASRYLPWIFGAAVVLILVALASRQSSRPAAPAAATPPTAAPPDLGSMSPAERFARLYQRVITAAQSGDQATVNQFTPMAIQAFGMLDTVTVDARYHLAMLQLHVGDLAGAQSQSDSIRRENPDHLFGYVIAAAVARWKKDDAARDRAYRDFLKRYDAEIGRKRGEYVEHRAMLEEVKRTAAGGKVPG